jgi:hypothetical protein
MNGSTVTTVAQIPNGPVTPRAVILFVDEDDGSLYFSSSSDKKTIRKLALNGVITRYVTGFMNPLAMIRGPDGALYVADEQFIRVIRDGQVTILAGSGPHDQWETPIDGVGADAVLRYASSIWFDNDRLMFWDYRDVRSVSMDGKVTTIARGSAWDSKLKTSVWSIAADLHRLGQAIDKYGNRYYGTNVSDRGEMGYSHTTAFIKRSPDGTERAIKGIMYTIPVTDGPIETATFHKSYTFGCDRVRNILYLADYTSIRKITPGKRVTAQLMGEQLYRQSELTLPPNVVQTISEFSGAKDPKRVFLDAVKNKGVALPRPVESETEEALRLELAKPDPNQSKIAALRRELARKGGRRTRRRKVNRKKKMTRKRRSTSS